MKQEGKRSLWQRYSDYCFRQALWVGWGFILLAFAIFLTIPVGAAISNQLFLGEIERNVQRLEKVEGAILIDRNREFFGDWASQGSCDFVVDELW